jgi:hypothetical protein
MFKRTTYNFSDIVPPPAWKKRIPEWNATTLADFDLPSNERLLVWLRTAGNPNFKKMYGRNDSAKVVPGKWLVNIVDCESCSMSSLYSA